MSYRLERTQVVACDLPTIFAFFKTPRNLQILTPDWLRFRILRTSDAQVQEGTIIYYALRWHGVPMRWRSRITEYQENALFADEMIEGPYRRWYHRHLFRGVPGGVEIADEVEYELPFGLLGNAAHALMVRRQVNSIFDYRAERVGLLFGHPAGS